MRSQSRLHTFTRQLRRAILHNSDVASVWRPAARTLDIQATLDKKLNDQSFACASTRVTGHLVPQIHVPQPYHACSHDCVLPCMIVQCCCAHAVHPVHCPYPTVSVAVPSCQWCSPCSSPQTQTACKQAGAGPDLILSSKLLQCRVSDCISVCAQLSMVLSA